MWIADFLLSRYLCWCVYSRYRCRQMLCILLFLHMWTDVWMDSFFLSLVSLSVFQIFKYLFWLLMVHIWIFREFGFIWFYGLICEHNRIIKIWVERQLQHQQQKNKNKKKKFRIALSTSLKFTWKMWMNLSVVVPGRFGAIVCVWIEQKM